MTTTPEATTAEPSAGVGSGRGPSAETAGNADGPRRKALRDTRIAWAVALGLQALNLGYAVSAAPGQPAGWSLPPKLLGLGVLLASVAVAHTARLQAYKRGWRGRAVTPAAYARGNLYMLVSLTLGACLLLAAAPFTGADRQVVTMLGLAAVLATALNWPHGRPMTPAAA